MVVDEAEWSPNAAEREAIRQSAFAVGGENPRPALVRSQHHKGALRDALAHQCSILATRDVLKDNADGQSIYQLKSRQFCLACDSAYDGTDFKRMMRHILGCNVRHALA